MRRFLSPSVTLFVIAPILAEVLPGATPPIVFLLVPPVAIWETLLYGCGALLVRQLARRWNGGWWTVLVLGAAYGLIEEGLSLKVIFNTAFEPAGALSTYGRVGDIATVFAAQVTVYHAVVSITIPILLTELAFPKDRDQQWLKPRALRFVAVLWVLALVYGFVVVHPEAPPATYGIVVGIVAVLILLAWSVRHLRSKEPGLRSRRWVPLFAAGFGGAVLFLGASWSGPDAARPPLVSLIAQIAVVVAAAALIRRLGRGTPLTDRDCLALASGVLAVFIVADLFKPAGAPLLAIVAVAMLVMLGRRISRRSDVHA